MLFGAETIAKLPYSNIQLPASSTRTLIDMNEHEEKTVRVDSRPFADKKQDLVKLPERGNLSGTPATRATGCRECASVWCNRVANWLAAALESDTRQ
jgi:hypothetical protein